MLRLLTGLFVLAMGGCSPPAPSGSAGRALGDVVATYSIVARDPATGDLGIAVASKYFGVGSVVPWARAGIGAVATQALPNIAYGVDALELLEAGTSPADAVQQLTAADPGRDRRQLAIIDAAGQTAAHTGSECHDWAGDLQAENLSVQGNLLAGETVLPAMVDAFQESISLEGSELADGLLAALRAGEAAGGDKRGRQSAAILVVREGGLFGANRVTASGDAKRDTRGDRYVDLRVEDHLDPVAELARLLELHKEFFGRRRSLPPSPPEP